MEHEQDKPPGAPGGARTDRAISTPDDPSCDPWRRDIGARLLACNADELEVVDQLLARIERGRDTYGLLDLNKARDWDRELAEELLDVQVYRAIGKVREKRARVDEISDRFADVIDGGVRR